MTVNTVYVPDVYNGDGVLDTFPITFDYRSTITFIKVSIKVDLTGVVTEKSAGSQYNVGSDNVVFTAGNIPATGETVIIELSPDFLQQTDYVEGDTFPALSHEAALDKVTILAHINKDLVARSAKIDSANTTFDPLIPDPSLNASKFLGIDATGTRWALTTISSTGGITAVVDDGAPVLGGNLVVAGFSITSISNGNVVINANGSGTTILQGNVTFDDTNVLLGPHGASAGNTYEQRFGELAANGAHYVGFKARDAITANIMWLLPDVDGAAGQVLSTDGVLGLEWADNGTLQQVNTQTGAVATGTTVMPSDDTIPQITEGDEYMTLAITPLSATSKLKIDVVFVGAHNIASEQPITAALFQDSTADALAAVVKHDPQNNIAVLTFSHYMTSGTTSSTTFKIRAGVASAGTTTFNGESGSRRYGGVMASSITITEVQP